jgi:hypothetical protein
MQCICLHSFPLLPLTLLNVVHLVLWLFLLALLVHRPCCLHTLPTQAIAASIELHNYPVLCRYSHHCYHFCYYYNVLAHSMPLLLISVPQEDFGMGAFAGALAAASTTPLDVIKTRMMCAAAQRPTMASAARDILAAHGPKGFLTGARSEHIEVLV